MTRLLGPRQVGSFVMAKLTHNPFPSPPVKLSFLCLEHYSVDSVVAESCLQTPRQRHSHRIDCSARDCYPSFLDLRRFLYPVAETHRCCPYAVDYSPRVVDCFARTHLTRLKNGMPPRTCLRELAAAVAGSEANLTGTLEMMVVFGFVPGFAGLVSVPRLPDQDFVVASGELLKAKGILCDPMVSFLESERN